ncbi:MAG: hypothetical protein IT392_12550 [Nitrospirae bacterium]|nr:hypothetical protein [Nitrospirota bacterium]
MGNGKLKPAVADAGPIIHLKEIGCLTYLQIFPTLHIPDAVWTETVEHGHLTKVELNELENIKRHSVNHLDVGRFIRDNGCDDLDYGERECLYLCKSIDVPLVLTDDLAVRDAAKRLDIVPIGSLGVVIKSHHAGIISLAEAEGRLNDLYDISSIFVTRAIVEIAIEQLRQHDKRD